MMSLIPSNVSPFRLVYYGLRSAGLINKEGRPWSLIYSAFQIISVTVFGLIGVLEIVVGDVSLREIILALSAVAVFIQVYSKLIKILANEDEIQDLLNRLEHYRDELIKENKYHNQINGADYKCKKYIKYFNMFYLSFPFLSFISNFIADYSTNFEEPHLTHQVWIPWSMHDLWPYLAGTILITIMTLSTVVIYVSFCVLEFTFTFQISAYLEILQHRLETQQSDYKTIYKHHQTVMQFLRIYNETCSVQMYIETLVASLEPCGFGFALIKGLKNYEPGTFDLLYKMILVLFGPFLLCYCGQEISTQMEKLHESAYMSNWDDKKVNVRRDLYTMMLVTIRPVTLNYKLFITFNLECFATIMQGIYSYLTMISHFES